MVYIKSDIMLLMKLCVVFGGSVQACWDYNLCHSLPALNEVMKALLSLFIKSLFIIFFVVLSKNQSASKWRFAQIIVPILDASQQLLTFEGKPKKVLVFHG